MIGSIFDNSVIPALQQVAEFAQVRHNMLASNIANMDVPGYKARDLSVSEFQDNLKDALEESRQSGGMQSPGGNGIRPEAGFAKVRDSMKSALYHDQSDVGIEHQVAQISKNQMMHNMALTIMSSQFRLLQAAVAERV